MLVGEGLQRVVREELGMKHHLFEAGDCTAWGLWAQAQACPVYGLRWGSCLSSLAVICQVGTRIHPSEGLGYPRRKTQRTGEVRGLDLVGEAQPWQRSCCGATSVGLAGNPPRNLLELCYLVAQTVKNLPPCGRSGFDPWVGKIPWRRAWQPTSVFLPGEPPWTEEPGGPQSMESQRVGHD